MRESARIVQISVSPGGVPKRAVPSARVTDVTASFLDRDYSRVSQKRHQGDSRVYARVLREGSLTSGDPVQLLTEDEALALIGPR